MHVVLQPSPSVAHKYRVLLPNKRAVDFGQVDFRDYTEHGNPKIMRAHLLKRGAIVPSEVRAEANPYEIHRGMLMSDTSDQEDWDDYFSTDYWERWLLWSYPTVDQAKLWMTMRKGVLFMPTPESMWFANY